MKKFVSSILLALVITGFGASIASADGGQYIVDRMDRQMTARQGDAVSTAPTACYDQHVNQADGQKPGAVGMHVQCH